MNSKGEELIEYVTNNYPDCRKQMNLRFELGYPYKIGSRKRRKQVICRVTSIFKELFKENDFVNMYIECFDEEDIMFGNTTPNYLYDLLKNQDVHEKVTNIKEEDIDDDGNTIYVNNTEKIKTLYAPVNTIPYKKIFKGISNYEQGREPSIGHRIYFINMNRGILFYMYDDRGFQQLKNI